LLSFSHLYGTTPAAKPYSHGTKTKTRQTTKTRKKKHAHGELYDVVHTVMRAAVARKEMEKAIDTSTTRLKKKTSPRQTPHLRRTQSLSRPHLERHKKMARIHPQKPSGYTPPPYRIVNPHCTSHLHKNH
jgi:hypothetical protein